MVAYLSTNSTRRRYFGSALILTFPPKRKNLNNPFSWMRFGLAMSTQSRGGGRERESSASNAAALLPPFSGWGA
jgi:hypothetical protein